MAAKAPVPLGAILFGKLADMWRSDFVECQVGARSLVAVSTRAKYINHLDNTFCLVGRTLASRSFGRRTFWTGFNPSVTPGT